MKLRSSRNWKRILTVGSLAAAICLLLHVAGVFVLVRVAAQAPPDTVISLSPGGAAMDTNFSSWVFNATVLMDTDGDGSFETNISGSASLVSQINPPSLLDSIVILGPIITIGSANTQGLGILTVSLSGDASVFDEADVIVQAGAFNRGPVLNIIDNQTVMVGTQLQFTVTGLDPDADNLTFTEAGIPGGSSFNVNNQRFKWTPTDADVGDHTATFKATDDRDPVLSDTLRVAITVEMGPEGFEPEGFKGEGEGEGEVPAGESAEGGEGEAPYVEGEGEAPAGESAEGGEGEAPAGEGEGAWGPEEEGEPDAPSGESAEGEEGEEEGGNGGGNGDGGGQQDGGYGGQAAIAADVPSLGTIRTMRDMSLMSTHAGGALTSAYYSRKAEEAVEQTLTSSVATSIVHNVVYRPVVMLLKASFLLKLGLLMAFLGLALAATRWAYRSRP